MILLSFILKKILFIKKKTINKIWVITDIVGLRPQTRKQSCWTLNICSRNQTRGIYWAKYIHTFLRRVTGRSLQNLNILYHSIWHTEIATVSVPSRTVGRIVGSNGGVIWRIGQKSGCKVEVEVEDHGRSRIHLMESSRGVQTARKIIGEKFKESDLRDITFGLTAGRRRRRRSRRRKKRRITSISNYQTIMTSNKNLRYVCINKIYDNL